MYRTFVANKGVVHNQLNQEVVNKSRVMPAENGTEDVPLFDPRLIQEIPWDEKLGTFKNGVSPSQPGENLVMRPLSSGDYDRGYMPLLSQLTKIGDVTPEKFTETFNLMRKCQGTYYICVLVDTLTDQVIGSATLLIEQKFIHSAALRGRIEDVVVNEEYRGKQLGKLLTEAMTLLGKQLGVYKISLECKDENIPFYNRVGYKKDEGNNFMVQRYKD